MHWHLPLLFGFHSAPKLFNTLADLQLQSKGVLLVLQYLDDFLTIRRPHRPLYVLRILTTIKEGPSRSLAFLGIILSSEHMEAHLPEKFSCVRHQLAVWKGKQKAMKWEILSLVSLLQHATKAVQLVRTFVSRMYNVAAKLRELWH